MAEAHRFAQSFAERSLKRESIFSGLENISGIGPKRKEVLLKTFGSLEEIKEASLEEIARLPGFNKKIAQILKEALAKPH